MAGLMEARRLTHTLTTHSTSCGTQFSAKLEVLYLPPCVSGVGTHPASACGRTVRKKVRVRGYQRPIASVYHA